MLIKMQALDIFSNETLQQYGSFTIAFDDSRKAVNQEPTKVYCVDVQSVYDVRTNTSHYALE